MAQQFTRTLTRTITLPSHDSALPDSDWVLRLHENGVNVRRKGAPVEAQRFVSWRNIIGYALIFKGEPS